MRQFFRQHGAGQRMHDHIGQQQVNLARIFQSQLHGIVSIGREERAISQMVEQIHDDHPQRFFVIHHQNGFIAAIVVQRGFSVSARCPGISGQLLSQIVNLLPGGFNWKAELLQFVRTAAPGLTDPLWGAAANDQLLYFYHLFAQSVKLAFSF
jgi:hypothetical protein